MIQEQRISSELSNICKATCELHNFGMDIAKDINKIAHSLHPNQWLRIGSGPSHRHKQNHLFTQRKYYNKPNGSYYSKGDWLFHKRGIIENFNQYITIIEVDYSNIKIITNINELNEFMDEFKFYDTENEQYYVNWNSVSEIYDGFVMIPNIIIEPNDKVNKCNSGYDTSTLVIWNFECVLSDKTIGKVCDLIHPYFLRSRKKNKIRKYMDEFIDKICVNF